jgi:hypothetical protein
VAGSRASASALRAQLADVRVEPRHVDGA